MIYKDNGKYQLHLGDVLEILKEIPDNSIDMIFTSPPYNIGLKDRKDTNIATYDSWDDNMEWEEYCNWQVEILNECFRVVKDGGTLFYNHKDKFKNETYHNPIEILFRTDWKIKQNIIWDRTSALSYNAGMFGDVYENIYYCYKGNSPKTKTCHNIMGTIWKIPRETNNNHPAPFPLELPLRAIYSIFDVEENKTILDIFNGSGTTGVASLLMNHKYIGIDISGKYLDMSIKRLDNYMNESMRGQIEIDKHVVENAYQGGKKITNQTSIFDFLDE